MGKRKGEQEQGADSAPVEDAFEAAVAAYFRVVIAAQLVAELHCKKPLVVHVHHGDGTKRVQIDRPVPLAEAYAGVCPGEGFPPREVIERLQAVEHTDIDACHRWVEDVYKEARALLDPIVADGFLRMPGCPPVARVGEQYIGWLKRLEAGYLEFRKDVLTGSVRWRKHASNRDAKLRERAMAALTWLQYRLYDFMWGKESAALGDVIDHVWGHDSDRDEKNLKPLMTKAKTRLLDRGVKLGWDLHVRGGALIKERT